MQCSAWEMQCSARICDTLVISYFYNDVTQLLTQLLFVRSN